jgi:3-oxoacyl-[acyl-carrier-protein] synthase II
LYDVFKGSIPPIAANKSMIGHCMGASSAIETIWALKSLEDQVLLPTINYLPDPAIEIDIAPETSRSLSQQYVLKNSFGFGGCNACVVFKKTV